MAARKGLESVRAILLDLSGTLHIEDSATPGAVEALARLRKSGFLLKFVTNTTKESQRFFLERLQRIGFAVNQEELYSTVTATRQYILRHKLRPFFMINDDVMEDFSGIETSDPNAVVVGLAPNAFNYSTMNKAFNLLKEGPAVQLVAMHKGRYYRQGAELSLGPGPFVEALEFATGKEAVTVGKPSSPFFRGVLDQLGCAPEEAVMVGDDWCDDIEGAMSVGMRGVLVQTGKYRHGDEDRMKFKPTLVCKNFAETVKLLLNNR